MKTRVTTEKVMKSISTEDIFGVLLNFGRVSGILFAMLLAVMLFNWVVATSPTISDSDASTYIIVPMLMVPLFALFMVKENLVPKAGRKDMLVGIALFVVFLLLSKYMSVDMGYLAGSYKISLLLFPIAILSVAVTLFGVSNIRRFWLITVYGLFMSPLLLLPVIGLNSEFATLNSIVVYHMVKVFFPTMVYSAPIALMLNGVSVSIGETCVGVGALIALVMFMIPLAYLYDGTVRKKFLWIVSGFLILLALNIIRMATIAILWFKEGPSQQLLDIHSFIGQLIFYVVVVLMILLAGKYVLRYPNLTPVKEKKNRHSFRPIAVAITIAAIYFLISLPLPNAQSISPLLLANSPNVTFTQYSIISLVGSLANLQNYTSRSVISSDQKSAAIYVYNMSNNTVSPLIILFGMPNQTLENTFQGNIFLYKTDSAGNVAKVYELYYDNNYSFVYYGTVPYYSGGLYYDMNLYAILTSNPTWQNTSCQSELQLLEDAITNAMYLNFQNQTTVNNIQRAYCFISKVVK